MGISTRQYQDIMNEYDAVRRRNYMAEQERKERVYALIPEIRQIDEQIAHISVEKAKALLLKQVSNLRQRSLCRTRFMIFLWKRSTCWRSMITRQIILTRFTIVRNVRTPAI